jgi:hypothetical protein
MKRWAREPAFSTWDEIARLMSRNNQESSQVDEGSDDDDGNDEDGDEDSRPEGDVADSEFPASGEDDEDAVMDDQEKDQDDETQILSQPNDQQNTWAQQPTITELIAKTLKKKAKRLKKKQTRKNKLQKRLQIQLQNVERRAAQHQECAAQIQRALSELQVTQTQEKKTEEKFGLTQAPEDEIRVFSNETNLPEDDQANKRDPFDFRPGDVMNKRTMLALRAAYMAEHPEEFVGVPKKQKFRDVGLKKEDFWHAEKTGKSVTF